MRSIDWARTPVGPVDGWPQSLRTALSILLAQRNAVFVFWGPEHVQFYNDAYRPILGTEKHPAALGQRGSDCWPEIWDVIEPMLAAVHAGESTAVEDGLLLINRHGYLEEGYYTYSYSPIRNESGEVGGVFCIVHDVTARVIGERRLRTLRDLAAGLTNVRSATEICRVAAEILGRNAHDVPFASLFLPGPCFVAGPLAEGERVNALLAEVARTNRAIVLEDLTAEFGPVPSGAWKVPPSAALALPLQVPGQDGPAGYLIAGINPHKRLDDDYRTFLELVAGQIAGAMAEAAAYENERRRAEALAEIDRAKTTFFSNVSHEFRTPLTLLAAPLQDLLDRGGLPGEVIADVAMMMRNVARLQRLVNTLLDFARIEAGRIDASYVPTDLARYTQELASAFESAMARAGLEYRVECEAQADAIYVDRSMWEKIVLNLVSNAFKHTRSGRVHVRLARRDGGVALAVADTGSGIPEAELPHVFDRFHRVKDAQARSLEGSGIGLALVQELVRLHGGRIDAVSEVGRGSTFTVWLRAGREHLPAAQVSEAPDGAAATVTAQAFVQEALGWLPQAPPGHEAAARPEARGASPGADAPVVIVADDNTDMRDYVTRLLADSCRVIAVADGDAALAAARGTDVDLVLADVMMPGRDGFALLAELKQDARTRDVPVVLLSARAGEEARIEGLHRGAEDYLVKPFSARELRARAAAAIGGYRTRRAAARRERETRMAAEAERRRVLAMMEQAPALIAVMRGPEHVFELANAAFAESMGRSAASLVGKPAREALPEVAGQGLLELLDDVYRSGYARGGTGSRVVLARGARYLDYVYHPYRDPGGAIQGVLVQAVDVTDLVEARTRVQEHGAWLQKLLDFAPVAIELIEPGTAQPRFANRAATELAPGVPPEVRADLHRRVAAGEPLDGVESSWDAQRERRWLLSYGHVLPPMHGQPETAVLVSQETTAIKRVEEELRHNQKLQAIGRLAGGIAHEYNNLLTVVIGNAALLAESELDASSRAMADEIHAAADRAALLTSQLLAFGRKQMLRPEEVSLNAVVRRAHAMFSRVLSEQIVIHQILEERLDLVRADPRHLEQVLVNLVLNAQDAMPRGGTITIRTANAPGHVILTVQDTGVGMTPEVREHIFDPFYTTKPIGKGTGMGLPMVEGIVMQSGGRIEVESMPGEGATFRLVFPSAKPYLTALPAVPPVAARALTGRTVLVVEDDLQVLRTAVTALQQDGHRVLAASVADEALGIAHDTESVDLILSDVVMPRTSGPDLVARIRARHPDARVIYMSGYSDEVIQGAGLARLDTAFLPKPFTPSALREKVRQLLSTTSRAPAPSV